MKNSLNGLICTCLLLLAGNLPGRAQEKQPDAQPAEPPQVAASEQPPAGQQTAPPPTTPPQQTPPAGGQTPTPGQVPTPPGVDQPKQISRIPPAPPPPVKVPDVRRPGESGFWIGVTGWFPKEDGSFDKGNKPAVDYTQSSFIRYRGTPKTAEGIEVGLAVGLHNTLKLDFTDLRNSGDFTTPNDVVAGGQLYTAGTYLSTNYHLQTAKLSYEYLTWPFPVGSRKIRLKTLWQVQFTQVYSVFDSPFNYYTAAGSLILDSSGNPINLSAPETKKIISPMFGLALSYYPSRHVRLEFSGSGFGFPHKYLVWDSEATVNVRLLKHFELRGGAKALGFKTSTNADFFMKANYAAAFVGFRWYSNSE